MQLRPPSWPTLSRCAIESPVAARPRRRPPRAMAVVAVTLLLAACTHPGRRPAGPAAKASGPDQLRAEPLLAQPPGSSLVLRNERAASQGVLGDSSAYVTTFW